VALVVEAVMATFYNGWAPRWPPKPPKNTRCDTHLGPIDTGMRITLGPPEIARCPNEAVETVFGAQSKLSIPMWLCTECVEKFDEMGRIRRNPKRKR
jgi:hypothetical protein